MSPDELEAVKLAAREQVALDKKRYKFQLPAPRSAAAYFVLDKHREEHDAYIEWYKNYWRGAPETRRSENV